MLEKMDAFFEARLENYDDHMLSNIAGAREFYPFTAAALPAWVGATVLDLGCGTGLELEFYFACNPDAWVTGIDLSAGMLQALEKKFPDHRLELQLGSYFDLPFAENFYDAAVSVESLHHFTQAEKTALYAKLYRALKPGGYFVLTDYFAENDAEETAFYQQLQQLKMEQGITDSAFYHFDTPLTTEHECQALQDAGFSRLEILKKWGATSAIKAWK